MGCWGRCNYCDAEFGMPTLDDVVVCAQICPNCKCEHDLSEHERRLVVAEVVERIERLEEIVRRLDTDEI